MRIITISREFGSGGKELGKRLADELGAAFYDKEIVTEIAKRTALNEEHVEKILDRKFAVSYPHTFCHSFAYIAPMIDDATTLLAEQRRVLNMIAEKGEDCIIVGRGADVILEKYSPVKLFVYADTASKIQRCKERAADDENLSDKEIEKKMKQIDRARANHHGLVSDMVWGDKRGYDLCINTSGIEIKKIVPLIAQYAKEIK